MLTGASIAALVLLCVQNSVQALIMRYSRGILKEDYTVASTLLVTECSKLCVASVAIIIIHCRRAKPPQQPEAVELRERSAAPAQDAQDAQDEPAATAEPNGTAPDSEAYTPHTSLLGVFADLIQGSLPMAVPAAVFFMQNSLNWVGPRYLDAASVIVIRQLKVLTTAMFSVLILGRKLSCRQWRALMLLVVGVSLTLVKDTAASELKATGNASPAPQPAPHVSTTSFETFLLPYVDARYIGVAALLCSATGSGFSMVYFEMMLKGSKQLSLFDRNFQLAFHSIGLATLRIYFTGGNESLFHGWSRYACMSIFTATCGGFFVAAVVKYADAIVKGFATASSIIVSGLASVVLFGTEINTYFALGALVVIASLLDYSAAAAAAKESSKASGHESDAGQQGQQQEPLLATRAPS